MITKKQAANLQDRAQELMTMTPADQARFDMHTCSYCAGMGYNLPHPVKLNWKKDFGVNDTDAGEYLFAVSLRQSHHPYACPTGPEGIAEFADRVENFIQGELA